MALPESRNTHYIDGATPIPAQDMNDLQDLVIQLMGTREYCLDAGVGQVFNDATNRDADLIHSATPPVWLGARSTGRVVFPIPVPVGFKLVEVKAYILDSASAVTFRVFRVNPSTNAKTQRGTSKNSAASSTAQTLTCDATSDPTAFPYVVAAGETIHAEVQFAVANFATQEVRGMSYKLAAL